MAVVQNPITGRSKQKYASAIFSTWKGINVLRSLPLSVANPRTPAQLLQRAKLRTMVSLYRLLPGIIALGFRQQAVKMSEYNAFGSDMMRNAFEGETAEALEIKLSNVSLAKGTMAPTPIVSAEIVSDDCTVKWDDTAPLAPGQSTSDLGYAAFIKLGIDGITTEVAVAGPVARTVGEIVIPDVPLDDAQDTRAYLFFVSVVGDQVSDSRNLGQE